MNDAIDVNDAYVGCFGEVVSGVGFDDDNVVVVGNRDVDVYVDDIVGNDDQGIFHYSHSFT